MNRRQKLKQLKYKNERMMELINASPEKLEIWKKWHEPFKNVIHSQIFYNHYKCQRVLLPEEMTAACINYYKELMARDLTDKVKENMSFKIIENEERPKLEASIYIGYKTLY